MINTIEDLHKELQSEEDCKKWLINARWGEWPICPFCNNPKSYIIENGKRFKCANKDCYKKYTVLGKTLMEASNLPYSKIVTALFIYVKSRGRLMIWDMEKALDINLITATNLKNKLDFVWAEIERGGKQPLEIMESVFKRLAFHYDKYQDFKTIRFSTEWGQQFKGVTDINNPSHYSKLIFYIRCYLHFTPYIWFDFMSPSDILHEAFIWLKENKITEYDSDMLIKYINRTVSRLWYNFLKNHPKFHDKPRMYNLRYRENSRRNLNDYYIIECIKSTKIGKSMTYSEIRANKDLINKKREEIKNKRQDRGAVSEWESHFD